MPTYNNNTPLATDQISATQQTINDNFSQLYTYTAVDHVALNATNQGMHKQVSFPVQVGAPVFGANILGLYNLVDATTGKDEVYVHKIAGAGTADIPFTASIISNTALPASNTGGWSYLPSGIILKFGNATGLVAGNNTVSYPVAATIPVFTQTLTVILCAYGTNTSDLSPTLQSVTNTDFVVKMPSGLTAIQYLALGY